MNYRKLADDAIRTFDIPAPRPDRPTFAIYMIGMPCAGKSVVAEHLVHEFGVLRFNFDQIAQYLTPKATFTDRDEEVVFELAYVVVSILCRLKVSSVFDANMWQLEWRRKYRQSVLAQGGVPICVSIETPSDIRERVRNKNFEVSRGGKPGFVMETQRLQYETNRIQPALAEEWALRFNSERERLDLARLVAGIKARIGSSEVKD